MSSKPAPKAPAQLPADDGPAMPFNEALKRVWSAPPAPRIKEKKAPEKAPSKT